MPDHDAPAYVAPGPLFRETDHHIELMQLRHDSLHGTDHTGPINPYAEYEPIDMLDDPSEPLDELDLDERDEAALEAAIDALYEGPDFQRRLEASWDHIDTTPEAPAPSPKPTLRDLTASLRDSNRAVIGELNMILHRMTTTLGTLTTDRLDDYVDALRSADKEAYEDYNAARRERDVLWDAILAVINKR